MRTAKHSRTGSDTAAMGDFAHSNNADLPSLYVRHSTADKAPSRASTDFCITASKSEPQDQQCIYSNSADACCRQGTTQLQDSSCQSRSVYFISETSSLRWKSKLRNAWGQYKCVSTLGKCFRKLCARDRISIRAKALKLSIATDDQNSANV